MGLRAGFAGDTFAVLCGSRKGALGALRQGWRPRQRGRGGGDDDARGRVNPFSGVVDAGVGADGADDGVSGDLDLVDALEQAFEDEAEVPAAAGEEPDGVGMTVNGRAIGEVVVEGDIGGAVPMDEVFLDGVAVGVAADAADARVAGGVRPPRPFDFAPGKPFGRLGAR
jgi:hypothetical protein